MIEVQAAFFLRLRFRIVFATVDLILNFLEACADSKDKVTDIWPGS